MTKQDIIDAVHAKAQSVNITLTKKDTKEIVDTIFEIAAHTLATQGQFAFPGFGTFTRKHRKARVGVNPQTKEPISIPETNSVSFKPAPKLKELVNS